MNQTRLIFVLRTNDERKICYNCTWFQVEWGRILPKRKVGTHTSEVLSVVESYQATHPEKNSEPSRSQAAVASQVYSLV